MESDNAFDSSSFQRGSHYSGGNNASSSSSSSRRWKRPRSRSRSRSRRRRSRSRSRSRHDRRERNSSRSRRDSSPSAALRTHHRSSSSASTTSSSSSAKRYSAPLMFQFPFHRYTEAPDSDYSCWLCGALNLQTHARCEHCDAPFISEPFRPYFEGLKRKGAHSNQGVLRSVSGVGFVRQLSTNFISQEDRESLLLHAFHALVASTPAAVEAMVQKALIQLSSTTHRYNGAAAAGGSRSGELTPLVELLIRAFAWTLYHHRGCRFKDEAERLQELSTALFDAEHRLYDVREIPVCRKRRMMPSDGSSSSSSIAEPEEGVVVVFTFASVEGAIHAAKNTRCSVVASPNVPHRLPLSFVVEQGGKGSVLTSTFPPITKTVESSSSDSRSNPQLPQQQESVAVVVAVPPLVEVANAEATFLTVEAEWAYLNSLYDVWEHLTPAHKSFYDARLPVVQQKRREAEAAAAAPVNVITMTAVQTAKDRGGSDGPLRQQSDASATPEKEAASAAAGGGMTLQERLAKKKADLLAAKASAAAVATGGSSSEAPSLSLPQTSAGSGTAPVDMSTTLAVASVKERLALLKAQRHNNSHAASATDSAAAPLSSASTPRQEPATSSSGLSSVSTQQQRPHAAAAAMSTLDPLTSQFLAWGGMELLPSEWGPIFGDPSSLAASASPTQHGAPVSSPAAANYDWTFSGIHPEVGARCLPRHVRPVSLTRAVVPDHA